jgi:hypothetical protein
MTEREQLIDSLSTDLPRVNPALGSGPLALLWLVLSAAWVAGLTWLMGPLRPGAWEQLLAHPQFLAETLCGVLAIVLVTVAGFRAAVPGALAGRLSGLGFGLLLLWLACYLFGLWLPALEPSMLGKREYCMYETLIYGLPPVVLAFALTRRLYPLEPLRAGVSLSLAAAMMPALYMQMACMYIPSHILLFHILPGLALAALAIVAVCLRPGLLQPQSASRSR